MANNNQHISYTAADLLAYARGQMDAKQMHALEKAALEDDFLAEALEGYMMENTKTQIIDSQFLIIPNSEANQDMIAQKLSNFKAQIVIERKKDENDAPKAIPIWRQRWIQYAAAAAVILGGLWFGFSSNKEHVDKGNTRITVAQNEPVVVKSEANSSLTDSSVTSSPSTQQNGNSSNADVPLQASDVDTYKSKPIIASPGKVEQEAVVSNYGYSTPPAKDVQAAKDMEASKKANDFAVIDEKKLATPIQNSFERRLDSSPSFGPAENLQNNRSQNNADRFAKAKRFTFQGRVVDANNNPLPYSNIMIPGEEVGTYSDAKGNFNFIYVDSVLPVRARSLGYAAQNYTMQPDIKENKIVLKEDEDLKSKMVLSKMERQAKSKGFSPTIVETDTIYSAEPSVGWNDFYLYSINNNRIANLPNDKNMRSVQLSFEVDKYGEVQNITVEKSLGKDADAEAIRLLKDGPKWKPKNGAKGKAKVTVGF